MNALYWVLISTLLVWGGLFFYLVATEARVKRLERQLEREERR